MSIWQCWRIGVYCPVRDGGKIELMSNDDRTTTQGQVLDQTQISQTTEQPKTSPLQGVKAGIPGVIVCLVGAVVSFVGAQFLPGVSALLIAIILGAVWRNIASVPVMLKPGITFSSKKLLRTGIILLGFQLSLSTIADLGFGVIFLIVAAVAITFFATLWVGHLLGIGLAQRLLIASGFSICGAAAVAATEGTTKAAEEEVATAIGLVVLFGTLMIPTVPFLGGVLGMEDEALGMWIGASSHEVAQVVAAGGAVGASALAVAVTVKLARVITLAPIIAGIAVYMRRSGRAVGDKKPAIVPLFVVGFVAAMLLRTLDFIPAGVLDVVEIIQVLLLAAAMFALGLGVHLRSLFKVGFKPVLLGLVSTVVILVVSYVGVVFFAAS